MDFFDRLKEYIEDNVDLTAFNKPTLSVGLLQGGNDAMIRAIPSVSPEKELDLSRVYFFSFQFYCRHLDQRLSYNTCLNTELLLDGLRNGAIRSNDNSFDLIKIDSSTSTNFVERTSEGTSYTAIFQAELFLRGE